MMDSFLRELSSAISHQYDSPKDLCIVLPSRRAGTFLKQELAKTYQKTIIAPTILTLDDFVENISGLNKVDNLTCFFELYEIYKELFQATNSKEDTPDTLEEFINWAPNLLADFNEIDKYLVNSISLFSYINEIRAIETWNINGEPLSKQQISYINLWKRIGKLYHSFKKQLLSKKQAYTGLLFRQVAENIAEYSKQLNYNHIIFAGFNAFSTSEQTIISFLIKNRLASVYWDADNYYLNDENQEAGNFLRKIKKDWHFAPFNWSQDHFKKGEKEINIYNCNTQYAQSLLAASLLEKQDATSELEKAIVLNKEDLLLPTLNNLPNSITAANITMGYEVRHTPMASFVKILLDLWYSKENKTNKNAFYYKNVLQVLEHSYFEVLVDNKNEITALKAKIIKSNAVYVSTKLVQNYFNPAICKLFFIAENQNLESNTKKILGILSLLKDVFSDNENNKSASENFDKSLHIEFIYHYTLVFRQLLLCIEKYPSLANCSLRLYRKLIAQLVNKEKISFLGEPLKGIQIMGMLETRALDFNHLILLSVNEGVLPAGKKSNSFIPFDVKLEFGLPTHREHDAIFANHFYRLLQRAKKIDLIYHTGSDDFGANTEKSRYIEQLIQELGKYNENIQINQYEYNPSTELSTTNKTIPKNDLFTTALKNRLLVGLSPSALNTMINCPLDYYYQYLLGIGEVDEIEESIQLSTFGTCIHKSIEEFYKPVLQQEITAEYLKRNKKNAFQFLEQEFLKYFSENELNQGSNLLSLSVAKNYLEKFFEFENSQLKLGKYKIITIEDELETLLKLEIASELIPITIKGKVDCVYSIDDELYILDYKTGKVEPKDLEIKSIEDLYLGNKSNGHKSKALQLLCYTWLYYQKYPAITQVTPCIFSFKKSKEGLQYLKYDGCIISKEIVLDIFPKVIFNVLESYFSNTYDLQHNNSSKYCEYCT